MRQLTNFDIIVREDDFLLRLETDSSETLEFAAPPAQIENIINQLNDLLDDEDEFDDDDEAAGAIYQKPLG